MKPTYTYRRRSQLSRLRALKRNAHVPTPSSRNKGRPRGSLLSLEETSGRSSILSSTSPPSSSSASSQGHGTAETFEPVHHPVELQGPDDEGSGAELDERRGPSSEATSTSEDELAAPVSSSNQNENGSRLCALPFHARNKAKVTRWSYYDVRPPTGYKTIWKVTKAMDGTEMQDPKTNPGDGFSGDEARSMGPPVLLRKRKRQDSAECLESLELVPPSESSKKHAFSPKTTRHTVPTSRPFSHNQILGKDLDADELGANDLDDTHRPVKRSRTLRSKGLKRSRDNRLRKFA